MRAPTLSMDTRVKPAYDELRTQCRNQRNETKPPQKPAAPPAEDTSALAPDDRVIASNLTLHELFQRQTGAMLERADLDDEQKQSILIAMSCPCLRGGAEMRSCLRRS